MKRAALLLAIGLATGVPTAQAQRPTRPQAATPTARPGADRSLGAPPLTAEVWFYQEELRRRADPRVAVREKAEFRSRERQRRIASRKWFGLSNARPIVSPTPVHGPYSRTWTAQPTWPYPWSGQAGSVHTVRRPVSGSVFGLW
jgi:hypothetical protein